MIELSVVSDGADEQSTSATTNTPESCGPGTVVERETPEIF
jgi:hypothetical protein